MKFEVFTTSVELQDIPSYTTNITLEGQTLRLSFLWNERLGKRVLSVKSSTDVTYLQNTILYQNESFELNSNAVFDDLPYKVSLEKVGNTSKVGNIYNWSKDFILCFSRTVDLDVKKLNVVYGVTKPSTPIVPEPSEPFGNWILNQGYELVGEDIKYTAYKTNGVSYYDSFANFDLVTALIRSFHDSDLQQHNAFIAAVNELTGVIDWDIDLANDQIKYTDTSNPVDTDDPTVEYYYSVTAYDGKIFKGLTPENACRTYIEESGMVFDGVLYDPNDIPVSCNGHRPPSTEVYSFGSLLQEANPAYDPEAEVEEEFIPLETVAQKIISNASSSSPDEILEMSSEDYIDIVANSVFDTNTSKQFVKLEDLIPQLEVNKALR